MPLVPAKPAAKPKPAPRSTAPKPAAPVAAQDPSLLQRAKIVAPATQMPDFVRQSRPADEKLDYVPVTGAPPEPTSVPMKPDEIRAREAELDAIRIRHDKMSGRRPAPLATKSVAGPEKPKPAAAKPAAP